MAPIAPALHSVPRRHGRRLSAVAAATLAGAIAATWPLLVAAPAIGGPLVALAAGFAAWGIARSFAPPAHANDDAPPLPPRRIRAPAAPGARDGVAFPTCAPAPTRLEHAPA